MKQGKKPNVAQKKWLVQQGLAPDDWRIIKNTPTEILIQNVQTGETKKFQP